jgi:hypothetical protein
VASGAIALALEANPDLTWRDVQYLIAYTSNPDIVTVDDLATNGAGLKFSHSFGFGAIDTEALVTRARHWTNVPEQQISTVPLSDVMSVQPSSSETIVVPIASEIGYLEHVVVRVSTAFEGVDPDNYGLDTIYENLDENFEHYFYDVLPNRGDIQIELTSPKGTTSILLPYRIADTWPGEYRQWPFMSIHFWGENPSGDWTLVIRNSGASGVVQVSDLQFTFYGTTETPAVISRLPEQCDDACVRGCAAAGPEFCDSCRQLRDAATLECVEECSEGLDMRSGYCYNAKEPEAECVYEPVSTEPTIETTEPTVTPEPTEKTGSAVSGLAGVCLMTTVVTVAAAAVLVG